MKLPSEFGHVRYSILYQPQISLRNGHIVGAEVQLQCRELSQNMEFPAKHFPDSCQNELFAADEWVLREACCQGKKWLAAGMPKMMLAVNICSQQLNQRNLRSVVTGVLSETGFPATQLVLEIAESSLEKHQVIAFDVLEELHQIGAQIAIDDFGGGYSSLADIKRLPVSILKIDKEFIDGIPINHDDMNIAANIVAMGHALGLKVIADGVETQGQVEFLQKIKCDSYQGLVTSPPIPAKSFSELVWKKARNA